MTLARLSGNEYLLFFLETDLDLMFDRKNCPTRKWKRSGNVSYW
ncbi:hypothetical protein [Dapis sp. BLCC M229]